MQSERNDGSIGKQSVRREDDLRNEYDLAQLKGGVGGKYHTVVPQFESSKPNLADSSEDPSLIGNNSA